MASPSLMMFERARGGSATNRRQRLPAASWSSAQAMVSTTPPSTRSAAPVVAEACGETA